MARRAGAGGSRRLTTGDRRRRIRRRRPERQREPVASARSGIYPRRLARRRVAERMGGAADTGCWAGAPSPRERAAARIVECDPTACPGPETWCDLRPTAGPGSHRPAGPRGRRGRELREQRMEISGHRDLTKLRLHSRSAHLPGGRGELLLWKAYLPPRSGAAACSASGSTLSGNRSIPNSLSTPLRQRATSWGLVWPAPLISSSTRRECPTWP